MTKREIDINNLKIMDISEVPEKESKSKWDLVFSKLPEGKVLVFSPAEVDLNGVRQALIRRQKDGKFVNFKAFQRTIDGKTWLYVVNKPNENP